MGTYINQNLLNNLFYILSSIFVYYFIYDHGKFWKENSRQSQWLFIACTGFSLLLCMKFPIYIADNCIHDLRQIPFLIGTLYGGGIAGGALLFILLIVRSIFYGFQFLTVVVYVTMFIVAALVSPAFQRLNRTSKLYTSVCLTFFLAVLTTGIAIAISDFQVTQSYIVDFILIPPFGMLFVVYIMETLKEAIIMRSKLIKVEKMEIVSQLAASISHEVRNPLTVVKGFIQLMKSQSVPKETQDEYMHIALEEIHRAETIINDYLTFAKPSTNKTEPLMVDQELCYVIHMLQPIAQMNGIKIEEKLQPGSIIGNAQHFRQCFLNLMKNSIEAMPNGGILTVSSTVQENGIIITVQDTGIGMTKEQISRFGEPYFSTKEKGTGLGSMVAVKLIETMNGTWQIQSEVGHGTLTTIMFPKA
ncbi:5TMR of 5TMR-LYT family protein [Anoxybacillus sp. B7M1]|jgi:two-component system, sporulation sensor kinase B|uniref:histidine kinase n=1 Tax=Anoxybacteroides rupiense TaxID=311460 RepID=A0ABT5W392_9BACL|nr:MULTISPECIES: HAMP domain-containing sensor histidine kinase [Anoxybacillus]ANB58710.1 5TMR of 5TMR-LYT family protein [Anoxybacillus sp. B2M1]ANB63610.1 5TMR of 5TMR-LYT family protein [Anoxybacillus sp. B7M1]KXG09359.1 Sporulation kinase A [Anoxybacillus sp. P3H1B]MDE8563788.1 HAMP domain-containing sensor histidine kinase [Anoxybacillus rupiensis]